MSAGMTRGGGGGGGVDKSDQFLAYHNVLRKTARFWKTLFYHLIDVAVVNLFILYNLVAVESGHKPISENDFRDILVLQSLKICMEESMRKRGHLGDHPRVNVV